MARKGSTAALDIRNRINAQMKGNVVTMGNDPQYTISKIPTGSLVIDRLTGGGFSRGRHSVLYGDFQACKSLIVYRTMALAQERGETCALVDTEDVFNERWFRILGGNPNDLIMYPDKDQAHIGNANELGNILRLMIQRGEGIVPVDVVGVDSVAGLLPTEEQDHNLEEGDARVASLARLMPLLLRQLTTANKGTAFIWTNQWRDKISRIPNQKSTPGGRSLGFFASTMIEMVKSEKETAEEEMIYRGKSVKRRVAQGQWVTCTTRKEKTGARPETSKSFLLDFSTKQPSLAREIVDLGMEDELIRRVGDTYFIADGNEGETKHHGIKKTIAAIEDDDELREWLVACIEETTAEIGGIDGA